MAKRGKSRKLPKLGKLARKGRVPLGRVILDGKVHYLGEYGTPECRRKYDELVGAWLARGRTPEPPPVEKVTVARLAASYLAHAKVYYRKGDKETSEVGAIKSALRPLLKLHSATPVSDFGPIKLRAVRELMIQAEYGPEGELVRPGLARTTTNQLVVRLRRMFRWGVSVGMVPAEVPMALASLAGLRAGRSGARETEAVTAPPVEAINAVLPLVSRQLAAMIRLQCLTGCRPGEIVELRPADVDQSGEIWFYTPRTHKTAHHGKSRAIAIGPKGQAILAEWLDNRPADAFSFSPREAEAERLAARHEERTTPENCGNTPGSNKVRKPRRSAGSSYSVDSYRRAIARACEQAGVEPWSPHQLRHYAGSLIRKQFGLEGAQAVLGHSNAKTSEIYSELSAARAAEIARELG